MCVRKKQREHRSRSISVGSDVDHAIQSNYHENTSNLEEETEEMKSLKNFINKKKTDRKFKTAGKGVSLAGSSAGSSISGQGASSGTGQSYRPLEASQQRLNIANQLAEAHEKRLAGAEKNLTYQQKKIREQARKELEEEQRQSAEPTTYRDHDVRRDDRDGEKLFEHSEQISTVLFTCDLLDDNVALKKPELIKAVEQFLLDQAKEEPVEASIIMIWSLNKQENIDNAVQTLNKILGNIVQNPTEPKFRKIKASNKVFLEKVKPVKGTNEFLKGCGFKEEIQKTPEGTEELFFFYEESESYPLDVLEDALISLMEGAPVALKLYRDPKVFRIDPSRPIPNPEIPADFFNLTAGEIKKEQQVRAQEAERQMMLRTAKMREEDARLRKFNYKYTLIRVKFPNHLILQGVFNVHEKFSSIYEFIESKLENGIGPFTFSDPIAGDIKFDDANKSFAEYGLFPAALLHFEWLPETIQMFTSNQTQPSYLNDTLAGTAEAL